MEAVAHPVPEGGIFRVNDLFFGTVPDGFDPAPRAMAGFEDVL